MEYKCWDDVKKLDNDKTCFRDWKQSMRGAYRQVTKVKGWKSAFEVFDLYKFIRMTGVEVEEVKKEFYRRCELDALDPNCGAKLVAGDWERMEEDLNSIIQAKSEDKSQARMIWRRSDSGIEAWMMINSWYMQTTGMGISQRRGYLMNPAQSKHDGDVIANLQNWMDEHRELQALGEEPLGFGYKITALKRIATPGIQAELERQERYCEMEGQDQRTIWETLYRYATNMSKDEFLKQREKKFGGHQGPTPMECNAIGGMDMGCLLYTSPSPRDS